MDDNERKRLREKAKYARKRRRLHPHQEAAYNHAETDSEDSQRTDSENSEQGGHRAASESEDSNLAEAASDPEAETDQEADQEAYHASGDEHQDVDADIFEYANPDSNSSTQEDPATDSDESANYSQASDSDNGSTDSEPEHEAGGSDSEDSAVDSDEEEEAGNQEGNDPIYPGAPITLIESLLAIFTFMTTQNVSGTLMQHVLQLIALHCPDGSTIKKTLKTFKSYFARIGSSFLVKHFFCSNCIYPLKTERSVCKKCKKSGGNATFFIEMPLLQQLQSLFNKTGFFEDLQFRFQEGRKLFQDNVEDIYDGNIYKTEMNENGFLREPNNISFMWYSDGIKIFKSSSFSVWPLCLVINELPYKKRSLPENILLVGLWFGKSKPNPNMFLRPLLKTMEKFKTDGQTFKLPGNREILVKGKILCGTCDLPAKPKFLQFKQYNGLFGCSRCMQEGGRADAGRSTVQVYPYQLNVPTRTHEETQTYAREALEARKRNKNASVNGVKGPSLLSRLVPNIILCSAIDIMHGGFLGVARLLVDLLFSSTYSRQPWSLHHLQDVLDEKLKKIKPPSYAARAPRTLKDIKFWKASEYKLFLLYYSVPLLRGLMEDAYHKHHCKLVSAISLLCQDSISFTQIQLASDLLNAYVKEFAGLYSIRFLGINVHQLVHLSDCVRELGPLWVYSCFYLENFNGTLNKLFHGTQHIALQICSAVSMIIQMPTFMMRLPPESTARQYCAKLTNSFKPFKVADVIDNCIYAVGNYYFNRQQVDHSRQILRQSLNLESGSFKVFYRLKLRGVMNFSKEYPVKSQRNESSYIKIKSGDQVNFGRIIRFVKRSDCQNLCDIDCVACPITFYAIVSLMQPQFWFAHNMRDVRIPYIFNVQHTVNVIAINVKSIESLCFCFEVDNDLFLCTPINRLENE